MTTDPSGVPEQLHTCNPPTLEDTHTTPPGDVRSAVRRFLDELGYAATDVADCVIDPWGVTVESFLRHSDGTRHLRPDHTPARISRHFPMTEVLP